jgi:Rne/Rng family ribonuclease
VTTPDEILVTALGDDSRAAALADGVLVRYAISDTPPVLSAGDVIRGRVTRLAPGIGAAFVAISDTETGILMLETAKRDRRGAAISEGQNILVQVSRSADAEKGARLTARPSLAGRFLVLLPDEPGVLRLSRQLDGSGVRAGLAAIAERVLPRAAGGWIVRSAACAADEAMLSAESARLTGAWQQILERGQRSGPPERLWQGADPVSALIDAAAGPGIRRIIVDDAALLGSLRRRFPDIGAPMTLHTGRTPLFAAAGVDAQLAAALEPELALPSGGRVSIAETAAVVAIDVDTGGAAAAGTAGQAALAVNLEAAQAIAAAVCLRELAGHLVIDFVPMRQAAGRARLLAALRREFDGDDRDVRIAGFTPLGLVEMTREKRGPSLRRRLTTLCPACDGGGVVRRPAFAAHEALRALIAASRSAPAARPAIIAAPGIAAALDQDAVAAKLATEAKLGLAIVIVTDPGLGADGFRIDMSGARAAGQTA